MKRYCFNNIEYPRQANIMLRRVLLIILILVFIIIHLNSTVFPQSTEEIKHEVDVKVNIIPIFVLDKKTNEPVLDLQKDDFKLFLNGKPIDLVHLIRKDFLFSEEIKQEEKSIKYNPKKVSRVRNIFILMDTVFNTTYGVHRTKIIVKNMVKDSSKDDRFNIFSISANRGLVYITGPAVGDDKLVRKIENTVLMPMSILGDYPPIYPIEEFLNSVCKIKSVLNIYEKPKIVYLFTGGYMPSRYRAAISTKVIDAMQKGGASLFTVNPGRIQSRVLASGSHLLEYMAKESGGQYYQGEETVTIIKSIKKSTSAYYEIVFNIDDISDKKKQNIRIKCLRKGIKILKPDKLIQTKTLVGLTDTEKRLFLLDAVGNGKWSKKVTQLKKAEFTVVETVQENNLWNHRVAVKIPKEIMGKTCEVYQININDLKNKSRVNKKSAKMPDLFSLSLTGNPFESLYFIILEKKSGHTLVGHISPNST
jgi:hypothetical protein